MGQGVWQYLTKLYMYLPFDTAIPLPGIYPKQYENILKRLFIASLFVVAKYWKLPKCSHIEDWLNMLCYMHTTQQRNIMALQKQMRKASVKQQGTISRIY